MGISFKEILMVYPINHTILLKWDTFYEKSSFFLKKPSPGLK